MSDREWLIESQKLITNVRYRLSHGLSETAMKEIDDYWRKFRSREMEGCSRNHDSAVVGERGGHDHTC